ncbi:hypothetical protein [Curtobacterium ammoniigenes]|uniref:hypothetical protein n=1 Tax=Curtobacterium ammoniigenes TaxID=395387 RepID=UPI00082FC737|nr:hypothetical protein [Curtobacterium ammoniigenes]
MTSITPVTVDVESDRLAEARHLTRIADDGDLFRYALRTLIAIRKQPETARRVLDVLQHIQDEPEYAQP